MAIHAELLNQIQGVRSAAASQDFELPVNAPGQVACYDHISAVDYNNALTLVTFGFKKGASEFLLMSVLQPAALFAATTQGRVFMSSDYTPFIRVTGGVAGDRIGLFVYGYIADRPY